MILDKLFANRLSGEVELSAKSVVDYIQVIITQDILKLDK